MPSVVPQPGDCCPRLIALAGLFLWPSPARARVHPSHKRLYGMGLRLVVAVSETLPVAALLIIARDLIGCQKGAHRKVIAQVRSPQFAL